MQTQLVNDRLLTCDQRAFRLVEGCQGKEMVQETLSSDWPSLTWRVSTVLVQLLLQMGVGNGDEGEICWSWEERSYHSLICPHECLSWVEA